MESSRQPTEEQSKESPIRMPLDGVRVLECGWWQQGPSAGRILADYGAEVIKIEPLVTGDPGRGVILIGNNDLRLPGNRSSFFETLNRNKKSIALDLSAPEGKQVVIRLARASDVFLQNLRPGVVSKLGIDYAVLSAHNPRLIYASLSGFGEAGPGRTDPALDSVGQARSGLMMTASPDGITPNRLSHGTLDEVGAITGVMGIVLALFARERLGIGQEVKTSLLSSALALQALDVGNLLITGSSEHKVARTEVANPLTNLYQSADGQWIAMHDPRGNRNWPFVCRALEIEHLRDDPRFVDLDARMRNHRELIELLDQIFAQKSREEWLARLRKEDVVVSPVNQLPEVVADPQTVANKYVVDFKHPALGLLKMVAPLAQLSRTPGQIREPAPELGQHTEEVLQQVGGYSWDEVLQLKESGVIV